MEYYINNATVKRYEKKRKSRAKNPKQPYTTYESVTIELSNKSEFKHGQKVVIISNEDYTKMANELEQLKAQNQQNQAHAKVDPKPNDATNNGNVTNEDIHQQLLAMDNDHIQLVNVQNELNQYKSMAIDWNGALIGIETAINKLIDEVIKATKDAYDVVIDQTLEDNQRALQSLLKTVNDIHQSNMELYQQHNVGIAGAIDQIVDATNDEIKQTSIWQMIRHKKDINLKVPTSDLMQPPGNIQELNLINNAHVMEKLQTKPNFGEVDITAIKSNLVNVPKLEEMTIRSTKI